MRRSRHKLQVSTFPFLAVLLGAMGALILLLLVMDRRSKIVARVRAIEAHAVQVASRQAEQAAAKAKWAELARRDQKQVHEEWESKRQELHEILRGQEQELAAARKNLDAKLAALNQDLDKEKQALTDLEKKILDERGRLDVKGQLLDQIRQGIARTQKLDDASRAEAEKMARDLAQIERAFQEAKLLKSQEHETYSLVPYRGKRGDNRKPVYVECNAEGLIFHPERRRLNDADFDIQVFRNEVQRRGIELVREKTDGNQNGHPPLPTIKTSPYVLFLVRPDGLESYYKATTALRGFDLDYGYEFIDPQWVLDFSNGLPLDDHARPLTDIVANQGPPRPPVRGFINKGGPELPDVPGENQNRPRPYPPGLTPTIGTGKAPSGSGPVLGLGTPQPYSEGNATGPAGFTAGNSLPGGNSPGGPAGPKLGPIAGGNGGGNGVSSPFAQTSIIANSGQSEPGVSTLGLAVNNNSSANPGPPGAYGKGVYGGQGGTALALAGNGQSGNQGINQGYGPGNGTTGTALAPAGNGQFGDQSGGQGNGPGGIVTGLGQPGYQSGLQQGVPASGQGTGLYGPPTGKGPAVSYPGNGQNQGGTGSGQPQANNAPGGTGSGQDSPQGTNSSAANGQPSNGQPNNGQPGQVPTDGQDINWRGRQGSSGQGNTGGTQGTDAQPGTGSAGPGAPGGGDPSNADPYARLRPSGPFADITTGPRKTAPPVSLGRLLANRDYIITVECFGNVVALYPSGQVFAVANNASQDNIDHAMVQAVVNLIARRQATVRSGETPYRPLLRFQVHPDALRTYFHVYPLFENLNIPMNRENLDS